MMCRFDPGGSIGMSAGGFTAGDMWFTNGTQIVGRSTINSVRPSMRFCDIYYYDHYWASIIIHSFIYLDNIVYPNALL